MAQTETTNRRRAWLLARTRWRLALNRHNQDRDGALWHLAHQAETAAYPHDAIAGAALAYGLNDGEAFVHELGGLEYVIAAADLAAAEGASA